MRLLTYLLYIFIVYTSNVFGNPYFQVIITAQIQIVAGPTLELIQPAKLTNHNVSSDWEIQKQVVSLNCALLVKFIYYL